MRQLFVVAVIAALALASDDKDQEPAAAANPYHEHYDAHYDGHYDGHSDGHSDDHHNNEPLPGPHVLRSTKTHHIADEHDHGPGVRHQNVIIRKTYDPDFYEPTIILDYRYMKTGGRDYVRGPGGQYLILPKGMRSKEHKEFENFDMLLEHLRLKHLAESEYRRAHYGKGDHH